MIDNRQDFDRVTNFRLAMSADGWDVKPAYNGEPVESASHGYKDNFTISILSRDYEVMKQLFPWYKKASPKRRYECTINIWGPDRLAIQPPEVYDFEEIKRGLRICSNCGVKDVNTFRYSFAGRCCFACLPKMRELYERPGWCD